MTDFIRQYLDSFIKSFDNFSDDMLYKIISNLGEKGFVWRKMEEEDLLKILKEYIIAEEWVSVANLAFMIWELKQKPFLRK